MSRRKKYYGSPRPKNEPVPDPIQSAMAHLKYEVDQAHAKAKAEAARVHNGNPDHYLDLSPAIRVLNENPALLRYVEAFVEREQATRQALGQDGGSGIAFAASYAVPGLEHEFLGKRAGSPTGSHPQSASATTGAWATGGKNGSPPQGVANAQQLRYFAENNEWVRAAINIRRQQIGRSDIAVVPNDERKKWDKKALRDLQNLLDQPNEFRDSYRSLMEPVIEDILVLDRGCISKNMTVGRIPTSLYYEDGATIKVYTDWDGKDGKPRYLYEEPGTTRKVPLRNDELICIQANPATYRVGLSPVQFLRKTIQAEMRAIESATHVVDMKPSPHIIQIPGAHQTQITNLRNNYDSEVAGRKELFWMGGDSKAEVFKLTFSARDNQWLEWQQWLARKIATAFQISPQQFGFTQDINKANGEMQQQIYEDTGLIPLLLLLEEYLNREILLDFAPKLKDGRRDLEAMNLRIIYPEVSEAERAMHAEKAADIAQKLLGGMPGATLNQLLIMRGEEPIAGGNTLWVNNPTLGPIPWLSYDGDYGDWNPMATFGVLGAQDPMGGPDVAESDPQSPKKDDNKDPRDAAQAQPGAAPAKPGTKPAPTSPAKPKPQAKPAPKPGASSKPKPKKPSSGSAPRAGDSSSGNGTAPNFNEAGYFVFDDGDEDDYQRPISLPSPAIRSHRQYDHRRPGKHWMQRTFVEAEAEDDDDEAIG